MATVTTETLIPQCAACVHRRQYWACKAFPNGIPQEIRNGDHDHREPFKGDNGIRFEPIEGASNAIQKQGAS